MTSVSLNNMNFFADETPYKISNSVMKILSTISSNPDEIVFGNFPSNPQCPNTPPSSPPRHKNTRTNTNTSNCNLVFTYRDIIDWINYERIMFYNNNKKSVERYKNQTTETTLKLIKEQQEAYELEVKLMNIYISTHNIIYS